MSRPIADSTIGSRFWISTDFSTAAHPVAHDGIDTVDVKTHNKHNSSVFTFLDAGGDSMARTAINKAELFAATHTLTDDERQLETNAANDSIAKLIGGEAEKNAFLDQVVELFLTKHADLTPESARTVCEKALMKLMATREFRERAEVPRETLMRDGVVPLNVRLDVEGLASAKNAVAGLAHMFQEGQLSENAALVLADSDYYDASNRSDLLRLAAKSAKKVKELFIGEERMKALIAQCETHLNNNPNLAENVKTVIRRHIEDLRHLMNDAIAARKAATACIKTDYLLTDPTGSVKDDSKFQKQQLDEIRNSLRAFRYDLDMALGNGMGGASAWLRRKADNLFSSKVQGRMTDAQFAAINAADTAFNDRLNGIRAALGIDVENAPAEVERTYANATANNLTDKSCMSVRASAMAATHLSHLTNDRIRYHFSEVEKDEAETFKAIKEEIGDIAEKSGRRTVKFRVTADFVAKLNVSFAKTEVKAGGTLDLQTEIKTSNPGGPVEVTFSLYGDLHAGGSAKFGVDPKDEDATDEQRTGFGAKVEANAHLGLQKKTTKTYANLDEFIKTIGRCHPLVNPKASSLLFSAIRKSAGAVGHTFVAGATMLGLRIHRSRMDQLEYSRELRDRNVFGPLAGVCLKKRNVEIIGERKAKAFHAGFKISGEAGTYVTEDGNPESNLNGGGAIGYDYNREFSVAGKMFDSFAKSLGNCSTAYLQRRLADELVAHAQTLHQEAPWLAEISNLCEPLVADDAANAAAIRNALAQLPAKLEALEESTIGHEKGESEFWERFAAKARILAVATALLAKRADVLDNNVAGAADAKAAAKSATAFILPRLANPVMELPQKLYQEKFFNGFNLATPPISTHTGFLDISFNLFDRALKSPVGDLKDTVQNAIPGNADSSLVKGGKELAGVVVEKVGDSVMDTARDIVPIPKKLQLKITRKNFVGATEDKRPWLRGHKTAISFRIDSGITLGIIVKAIAKAYVKSKETELTDEDLAEISIKNELWDTIKETAKTTAEDTAVDSILPLMDMSLGDLAKKYSFFDKMLRGAHAFDEKMKADYEATNDAFKTVTWEFGNDGRFSRFSVSDDTEYQATLKFKPTSFLEISAGMDARTSIGIYSVLLRPTANSLMERAFDYIAAGNLDGYKTLLAQTKTGVHRLIQAGRQPPIEKPDDDRWQKDCTSMGSLIADLSMKIAELELRGGQDAEDAREFRRQYAAVVPRILAQPADIEKNAAVDLAFDFFTLATKVYSKLAMT